MLASALCVCFGQLCWKLSLSENIPLLLGGFFLYGIGAFLMVWGYRFGKLSVLQPVLSINYVLSVILGFFFLDEPILWLKCLGVTVIIAGICLIAGGDEE